MNPPTRRNSGRLGDSNLLLVCSLPHASSRTLNGLYEYIWPIYVVDVSTLSATLIDQKPKVVGEDFRSPWRPMLAGEDGNIYQQGDPILRWNPQTKVWDAINISSPNQKRWQPEDAVLATDAGLLVAVDKESALYFYEFFWIGKAATSTQRYAKYAPDGTLQWIITNDDMQIKTQWMTLLRVMDNGKLVFWSENQDDQARKYEAYECTVNDGE
jgi:hypothetical protein